MRWGLRCLIRFVVGVFAAALALGALAAGASAHAFLIRSQPQPGSRLATTPGMMTLDFSEPFVRGTQRVSIQRANGHAVTLPPSQARGVVIEQPLPTNLGGIFIVAWRGLSDDGHVSSGAFAFAIGAAGALPVVKSSSQPTSWSAAAASWLVFVGLALALGGLVSERLIWRGGYAESTIAVAPVVPGVIVALLGGGLEFVLLAGDQRGGGFTAGLRGGAIADALGTRPGGLTLAILIATTLAGVLAGLGRLRFAAVVPLLAAVVFIADRGHSGTSAFGWAVVADSVHLAAVAAWVGALAHLLLIALRADQRRVAFLEGARRYARLALPTVLVILISGVLTAIPEFRAVSAVASSGYGHTLLIKSGFICVALLLALTARLRALSATPRLGLPLLRRLTVAETTTVLAVLAVAAALVNAAPARAPAAAQASSTLLGPPQVSGPTVRLADLAGQLVVTLTANGQQLQFTVFPLGFQAPGQLTLAAAAHRPDGTSLHLYPRSCGIGCFATHLSLQRGSTVVSARVSSSRWAGGAVRFAVPWPLAPERPAIVRRVAAVMRTLRSLTLTEQLTLGYSSAQPPTTRMLSGAQFMRTDAFDSGVVDVRSLGPEGGLRGFAFVVSGSNAIQNSDLWYRIWVDRRYRLRRELIVAAQGGILRTFRYAQSAAR